MEKTNLLPYRPKLELASISTNAVNKYSFIQTDNNSYSVPEYLVGRQVSVKTYYDKIVVYSNNHFVCEHKKIDGFNEISIDINHYLKSLTRKPGAIKNSLALKSVPVLKSIYDKYFSTNPKKFIEILVENKEKSLKDLIDFFEKYTNNFSNYAPLDNVFIPTDINQTTKNQITKYDDLCIREAI